jgi:protocatechuate 3,4-dioxygenase beta subunit
MPAGRTVRGRVTDAESGEPLAGASVGANWVLDRAVTTGADGRYEFPGWTGNGTSILTAKAPGHGPVWKKVPTDGDVDFALAAGDTVTGRLVRDDGSPIGCGFVCAYGAGDETRAHDCVGASTRACGRFELTGLQREMPHTLTAAAPGRGTTLVDFDPAPARRGTVDLGDVVLPAARSIEGLATDGDGRPLADTLVVLSGANDDHARLRGGAKASPSRISSTRRTDDLGRFRFPDLAPGTYEVRLFTNDAPRAVATRVVLPADRDVLDARVRLPGSRSVCVLVVDDTGAPLDEASIQVLAKIGETDSGTCPLMGWTDADGRATFRGLPAGDTAFSVGDDKHHRCVGTRTEPVIPDGQEVRVVLRRAVEIRGFVRGEDGAAVPLMSIKAALHRDGSDAGFAQSDEAGAFAIRVPAGEPVDLVVEGSQQVRQKEYWSQRDTGLAGTLSGVTGPAEGQTIVLRARKDVDDATLVVVVEDSAGVPVAGVDVSAYAESAGKRATTGPDGRARLDGLPAKKVDVSFWLGSRVERPRPLDIPPRGIEVVPRGQEVVVKFREGVAIRGRVVDSQGRPVPKAFVDVATHDYVHYPARCDVDGRFTTAGLPGVAHKLTARGICDNRQAEGSAEGLVPGDTEVTITIAPKAE